MASVRCSSYFLGLGADVLTAEVVSSSGWHVGQRQAMIYRTFSKDERWVEWAFFHRVGVMTSRLDNPPHCKHKLVFRSKNYSTTPRSLWRNNTHLLLPAGLTKPGYCHCKWFFSCVSTQEHRNRNVCAKVSVRKRQFFLPLATQPSPSLCHQSQRGCLCARELAAATLEGSVPSWQLLSSPSWDRQGSKAFPQGATKKQAWVFSSLCLKIMHCVFLPYIWVCFGLNSGGWHQFWSCSHSYMHTCVREGPEDSGSSNLIIQDCSVLFINQIAVLESWSMTGALHTETWKKKITKISISFPSPGVLYRI